MEAAGRCPGQAWMCQILIFKFHALLATIDPVKELIKQDSSERTATCPTMFTERACICELNDKFLYESVMILHQVIHDVHVPNTNCVSRFRILLPSTLLVAGE
jgi:hypothetical protein